MTKNIYLDHAAATPVDQAVLRVMQPYFSQQFQNPSASYLSAKNVRAELEAVRARIARGLGVRPAEIVFTAGATEANNLAIQGVMRHSPEGNVLVSAIEHDSVLEPAGQFEHKLIPVDSSGRVDGTKLEALINDQTVLVSVMMANNEIGVVQHLNIVAKVLSKIKEKRLLEGNSRPLYLHTDAAQALNYMSVFPHRLGVDLLSLNGGKIYGPKQSGLLFIKTGTELSPLILGGGQERGFRSGTENVPAVIGLGEAIENALDKRDSERKRLESLQQLFYVELKKQLPNAAITAEHAQKLPNLVHLHIPGYDNERLMMALDEKGIECAVGSACSASSDEPSHVLKAIGFSDVQAQSSLRFSMGRSTSEQDVRKTVQTLKGIIHG